MYSEQIVRFTLNVLGGARCIVVILCTNNLLYRFTERDFRDLGNEFLISEDDIRKLSRIARMPVIYTDKVTDEIAAR